MTVFEVLSRVMPKGSGPASCTIFEAVATVQDIIVTHLFLRRSDLLLSERDAMLTFKPGAGRKPLPEEFLGLADRPYLASGKKLAPLDGTGLPGVDTGPPRRYRLMGTVLLVYPAPVDETVVGVPYYARPESPESLDDELPFWGMFDSVFVDSCVSVLKSGVMAAGERSFVAAIQSQVDMLISAQELNNEQLMANSINGI